MLRWTLPAASPPVDLILRRAGGALDPAVPDEPVAAARAGGLLAVRADLRPELVGLLEDAGDRDLLSQLVRPLLLAEAVDDQPSRADHRAELGVERGAGDPDGLS